MTPKVKEGVLTQIKKLRKNTFYIKLRTCLDLFREKLHAELQGIVLSSKNLSCHRK